MVPSRGRWKRKETQAQHGHHLRGYIVSVVMCFVQIARLVFGHMWVCGSQEKVIFMSVRVDYVNLVERKPRLSSSYMYDP